MGAVDAGNFFHVIDGKAQPWRLVSPSPVPKSPPCNAFYLYPGADGFLGDAERVTLLEDRILDRGISHGPDYRGGYEQNIGLKQGGLSRLLEAYRQLIGKEVIRVLDSGCGKAVAFEEMLKLDGIAQDSVGVTMHSPRMIPESVRGNVVVNNVANLAPNGGHSFDVCMSVYGTITYHPFNHRTRGFPGAAMFGVLHAGRTLALGGLLITDKTAVDRDTVTTLVRAGILKFFPDLARFSEGRSDQVCAWTVEKHPDLDETRDFLRVGKDNRFSIV